MIKILRFEKVNLFCKALQINTSCITLMLVGLLVLSHTSYATNNLNFVQQVQVVKGKVVDDKDMPLAGVTILVKGSSAGTITDFDGNYSINVPANAKLIYSFIGFATQEIDVAGKTEVDVKLIEDVAKLDETIVVGYGKSEKRKITSAISTVNPDLIGEAPFASVIEGLTGRATGLYARANGGAPGALPRISIRGGNTPSFFVDGVVLTAYEFSLIPPNDIEDITLLKDNASSAVFGFDASNGVVVVTTKRGKKESITFSYNADFTYNTPTNTPVYQDALSKFDAFNKAHQRLGNTDNFYAQELIDNYASGRDPVKYPVHLNPFKEVVSSLAAQRRHNLSLNGSMGNTKIFTSLDYFDQETIYKKGTDFYLDRYAFRTNLTHDLEKIGLTISSNISYSKEINRTPPAGIGSIWSHVRNYPSEIPMQNYQGNYVGNENPLAESDNRAGLNQNEENVLNGQLALAWEIPHVPGLVFTTTGNYKFNHEFVKNFARNPRGTAPIYAFDTNALNPLDGASLYEAASRKNEALLRAQFDYERSFGSHNIDITALYEQRESRYDYFDASRRNFVSPAVPELFAGPNEGQTISGNASEDGRVGYVGRVKYDFRGKYILEASGRYDGYAGFQKGRQFKLFPSYSAAWNIDKEAFAKPILEKLNISYLKVSASIGEVGRITSPFSHLPTYSLITNSYYYGNAYNVGFREDGLVRSEKTATWETIKDRNLRLDFGLFNNSLTGSVEGFFRRETGFVAQPADQYTTPLGVSLPVVNTDAAFRRAGIEGELNYTHRLNENSSFYIGANVSYFDQLWEKRSDEDLIALSNPYTRLTQATDYYTSGYRNAGFYQNVDNLLNTPRRPGAVALQLGDIRYEDFNGDGKIDVNDFVRIGKNSFPHIVYNFTLGYKIKGFKIDALINAISNTQLYIGNSYYTVANRVTYKIQYDTWSETNNNALFPRLITNDTNGNNNGATSDFWLKNANYFRLKSLSITYDLKRIGGSSLDFFNKLDLLLSGVNLITISPLNKYNIDPETASSDNYGYPITQTYNIGLRASF